MPIYSCSSLGAPCCGYGYQSPSSSSVQLQRPQTLNFTQTSGNTSPPPFSSDDYSKTLNNQALKNNIVPYPRNQKMNFQPNSSPDESTTTENSSNEEREPQEQSLDPPTVETTEVRREVGAANIDSFEKAAEDLEKNNIVPFTRVAQVNPDTEASRVSV